MSFRERRWAKVIDGQTRTCVADFNQYGNCEVSEELIEQWMSQMGWEPVPAWPREAVTR